MIPHLSFLTFFAAVLLSVSGCEKAEENHVSPEKSVTLFNGTDLTGWDGDSKWWSVENGEIVGKNDVEVPSSTYLFTQKSYRNFRLNLEVKQIISEKNSTMHSAVCVLGERFADVGENAHGFKGPLLMFCHDWGIWDAYRRNRIVPENHKGTMKVPGEKVGEWNSVEVLVIDDRIRFVNNGALVFDFTDKPEMLQASPIGLQLHKNNRPQEFHFRNISIIENPEDRLLTLDTGKDEK